MEQSDWMARVSTTIANEVRRARRQRGMSAQKLADRCAELGAPIPRTVLSNLENGRRGNVTVAEWLVLAAALDVPPATLLFPVGYEATVESLPGVAAPPVGAVEWLGGHAMPDGSLKETDTDVALDRFREHRARAKRVDEILKHVSYLKSQSYARERDRAAMRVDMLRDMVSSLSQRAIQIMDARHSGDFEGTSDIHAVQEHLRHSESELAQAMEDLREAEVQAAVAASTIQRAATDIAELRADRKDMRQRGWTLPELPERVARVLEEGVFEKWLSEED